VRLAAACCTLLVLHGAATLRGAPAPVFTVTVVDGRVSVLRGPARFPLEEGVRLSPGDIIEVRDATFAQLEQPDGTALALGPSARTMGLGDRRLFLLGGWLKTTLAAGSAPVHVQSPHGAVTLLSGGTVLEVGSDGGRLFGESGAAAIDAAPPVRIKAGEFCAMRTGAKPAVSPRPPHEFISSVPRPFLDAPPRRLARVAARELPLKKPQAITYAEVEAWIDAAAPVRRVLAARWASKASDPAFRRALVAGLARHPEWEPVLFPEKRGTSEKRHP
jgi:hypothetical protein